MDFPVCPACGQSVIDDDVEDCPFCGSSMKSKPGAKPAAPKPAVPKASAGVSGKPSAVAVKPGSPTAKPVAGKGTAGAKAGAGKSSGDDDFPFGDDLPSGASAIQAMPNATKQRSLAVVCPMCETVGYVPPTTAGSEVKCANSKCLVPVFKAPVPVVEAPPPPKQKSNLIPILGVTAAVAVLGGVGYFILPGLLASKPKPAGMSDEDKAMMAEMGSQKPAVATTQSPANHTPATDNTSTKNDPQAAPEVKTADAIIAETLKQMNESCLVGDRRQRSKPFCRQQAAEANILTGDVVAAREHLNQLVVVGRDVPYYRIVPNLELFWMGRSAGDKAAATKSLEAALADAPKIPKVGRNQLEIAARLAAALAADGRIPAALSALQGHQSAEGEGQLAARVQMASDGRLARLTTVRAMLPWTAPQAVAATASLTTRGQLAAARAWAEAQPLEEAKTECLAIWAEAVARGQAQPGSADSNADLVSAVQTLPPQLAARVWARAACGRFLAKDEAGTAATLKIARDLLATVAGPVEPKLPEIKLMLKYSSPAATPLVQAATTATEIAFVQSLSPSTLKDADASLDQALQFARGLAPGLPAVSQRANEAEQAGASGMLSLLKRELALKSDDEARLRVGDYRRKLTEIHTASRQRFELQTAILSRLIDAGLKDKAWVLVSTRSAESDPSLRDDFLDSSLVGQLLEVHRGSDTEKAIRGALAENAAPQRPDAVVARELLNQGDAAAEFVSSLESKGGLRDGLALSLATSLATTGKLDLAIQFIGRLDDIVLREEAYRLTAGLAAQRGQSEAVFKQIGLASQATEKAALGRGLIGGLKATAPSDDLPEPAAR